MNILIPGGASYIGAWLVPHLLADGHKVTVYDTLMFGDGWLPKENGSLVIVKADVRDQKAWKGVCTGQDAVIYLASISREALCQAKPKVAQAVNVDCFGPDVRIAKEAGVKRFIYASSVAVYGSSEKDAKESDALKPTTIYGKGKAACESILWEYQSPDFSCTVTRSASVCGFSPRQRLDLTLNRMVHDGVRRGMITVEGGAQVRSHVHIKDICDFYKLLLRAPEARIAGTAFNVVRENQSVHVSALMVAKLVGAGIELKSRVDDRSYSVDGSKALDVLGWSPACSLESAVVELKAKFDSGYFEDSLTNPAYQNMADV